MFRWIKYKALALLMYFLTLMALLDMSLILVVVFGIIGLALWKYGSVLRGYGYVERDIRRSARVSSAIDKVFYDEYDKHI